MAIIKKTGAKLQKTDRVVVNGIPRQIVRMRKGSFPYLNFAPVAGQPDGMSFGLIISYDVEIPEETKTGKGIQKTGNVAVPLIP